MRKPRTWKGFGLVDAKGKLVEVSTQVFPAEWRNLGETTICVDIIEAVPTKKPKAPHERRS